MILLEPHSTINSSFFPITYNVAAGNMVRTTIAKTGDTHG